MQNLFQFLTSLLLKLLSALILALTIGLQTQAFPGLGGGPADTTVVRLNKKYKMLLLTDSTNDLKGFKAFDLNQIIRQAESAYHNHRKARKRHNCNRFGNYNRQT